MPAGRVPARARLALLLLLAAHLAAPPTGAAPFGRNKVQYDTFEWRVLETEHLEIHFYPAARSVAEQAAEHGEAACARLEVALGHRLGRKIPVVVYASHYHFRQNNVSPSLVGESTGGFTEIFRNRVVLPYAGSEEDFRHVVNHELVHAYCFDLLYGGPVRQYFVLQNAFYIPLWFMEGIAEWYSNRWDSEGEMMMRDASVTGALPPFPRIGGGYFVYKAGWSAVGWLVQRHGEDVIPRTLDEMKTVRDLRIALKNVTGEDLDTMGSAWLEDVRRTTWPTFATLDDADRLGRALTDHRGEGGAVRASPVLSPAGDRLLFLSNRTGTPDLWVMDLGPGPDDPPGSPRVLVHGSRGGEFKSLHPLRSSVGWSPDGRFVVAAAQKGARDALYVLDVDSGRTLREIVPDLDAVERPDWSPGEARFVFTGMRDGQVDLWTIEADGTGLARLTDDRFAERGPRWSPDGRRIVFASDRAGSTGLDLWTIAADGMRESAVRADPVPLRLAPGDQWDPAWSADGSRVWHASDESGTRDLMVVDVATGEASRRSALLGGVDSPSLARDSDRMVVSVYARGGWDLVLVENADTLAAVSPGAAPPVELPARPWDGWAERRGWTRDAPADTAATVGAPADGAATAIVTAPADTADTAATATALADPKPSAPIERAYDPRFRPEWITGSLAYAGAGLFGGVQTTLADVLGNHRVTLGASIFRNLQDSDGYVGYAYLPRRIDFEVTAFHVKDWLYDDRTTLGQPIGEEDDETYFSERKYGVALAATYPFHTFRRVGLEVRALEVRRTVYTEGSRELGADLEVADRSRSRALVPRLVHTFDNTLWGWTGPVQGTRSVASIEHSVPLGGDRIVWGTAMADARRYRRFGEYVVMVRGLAATSFGEDPQEFQLGGTYSLRGWPRREVRGRHVALVTAEFRYPFVEYVKLGWPLRTAFGGIRGDLFVDCGTAFDDPSAWRLAGSGADGSGLEDLRLGFGAGMRFRFAFLPIRIDVGWPTDLAHTGRPRWHFAIGPEI